MRRDATMTTFTSLLKAVAVAPPDLGGTLHQVGPYRIERRIGAGGMGVVYLGWDDSTGTVAAVKVIKPEFTADERFRARLRREVAAARRVPRFCTAPVIGVDLDGEPAYIATEFIDGPTLDVALLQRGPLRGTDLEGLATGIAVALQAIHDQGVVHRDLKPSNILLSSVGPRVIDFGIARLDDADTQLTQVGDVVGTPAYMAPEQLRSGPVTAAVDLFAWAGVVVYAATGRPPFGADSGVRRRILNEEPDVGALEEPLRGFVRAAFAKDHTHRPSASDLVNWLARSRPAMATRVLETAATSPALVSRSAPAARQRERPAAGSPPGLQPRAQSALRVHRNRVIVAASLVVALGGAGLALSIRGDGKKNPSGAESSGTPSSTSSPAALSRPECVYSPDQGEAAKNVGTPPVQPRYQSTVSMRVTTNLGVIGMDLDGGKASCTVNSFAYLASKNFFDDTPCHRLVTEGIKVVQCGDPTGSGTGGPAYKYADENLPTPRAGAEVATYGRGTVAMANAGPGTNGSQFFLVYGDSDLPPNYTIFGRITSGMGIIDSVANGGIGQGTSGDGPPKKAITIQDIAITQQ